MIVQPSEGINKANYFGSCATAAATAAKTVTIDGFVLEPGARVSVYFSNMNTAASPTLNVSGTGAYTIWFEYSDFYNYNALHELCEFVFVDGGTSSYWTYVGHPSSTLRNDAIGYTEYGTVARAAHSTGSYITWKDNFYKVSATIAAGDMLAVGTNLTETTVGDVLTELNANLTNLSTLVSGVEEQVGTLDGIPLYRKIYKADGTWTTDTTLDSTLKTTNIRIYKINESYNVGGSTWAPSLDYYTTVTGRQYVFIALTTRLYIQIGGLTIKGYNVEIFYTKIS